MLKSQMLVRLKHCSKKVRNPLQCWNYSAPAKFIVSREQIMVGIPLQISFAQYIFKELIQPMENLQTDFFSPANRLFRNPIIL